MTNVNIAAETISNSIYETKPYGTPEEFNLQTIPEKIIDVEYVEADDDLEGKSANDNGTDKLIMAAISLSLRLIFII